MLRDLDNQKAVLDGRIESLRVAQELATERRKDADEFRAAHGGEVDARGVLGELLRIPRGLEKAVEAVLGDALSALVVAGARLAAAVERAEEQGADVLLVPTLAGGQAVGDLGGARPLAQLIDAPAWLRGTIDALCDRVYFVTRATDATTLHASHPDATFVTSSGRVLRARGTSRPARSRPQPGLELRRSLEQAAESLERVERERNRHMMHRDRHSKELARLDRELTEARSELGELEGRIAAAADRLREIGAAERAGTLERDIAQANRDERLRRAEEAAHARNELAAQRGELKTVEEGAGGRLAELEQQVGLVRDEATSAEATRTELLTKRASLEERIRGLRRTREELAAERIDVEAAPTSPEDLAAAETTLRGLDSFVTKAEVRVRELLDAEEVVESELRDVSEQTSRAEVQVASLEPRSLHASEELARLDVRIEEIGTRLAHEFDIPPSRAREEFPPAAADEALDAEERRLDRELRRMGPVNPLAAREISQLDQRREFLETQLEDLRTSRRDLLKVVRTVDVEMREILVKAAEDANAAFQDVIGLLFPEGGGRLRLAGHEDPLEAGIEIEVRLGRKGHRRLSFLSGGEKALAGLAFLFALHLARPTPFLVLDEVDAPLDDANLGRFLRLLDSLRARTQVIVITHQKRTMERADTLVGVTLNADGTSRVVMQRLQEHPEHVASSRAALGISR
jgi:chromosome segregation protein